jgi:hypothetical protein
MYITILKKQSMLELVPYQKTFYYEWAKNPSRYDYNLVIDLTLIGEISPERLNLALIRFVNEHLYLARHGFVHYQTEEA